MTAIHQFLPRFAGRDAIGMHATRLQQLLRDAGYESDIYAADANDDVKDAVYDVDEFARRNPGRGDTWALYQFSIGSPLTERLRALDVPIGVDYHNITQARYYRRWEPLAAARMVEGRQQLAALADDARFALAVSHFNERELKSMGFRPTAVAPLLVDFRDYDTEPDAELLRARTERRERGGTEWLFVGRIAPNKCQHDVIAAFAAYRAIYDPNAHLTLAGDRHSAMQYTTAIEQLAVDLAIHEHVTFAGSVTHAELLACYRTSDIFVCLSEHEGFAVPVLEAMHFDIPVVAYASSAVPETVADAGLLLEAKDPVLVAAAANEVLTSADQRAAFVAAGRLRVAHFDLPETGPQTLATLEKMIA